MTEKNLDGPQVSPRLQQVRRETVTQSVWRQGLL